MRWKRPLVAVAILVALVAAYQIAWDAAQLYLWQAYAAGSYTYDLLFASAVWFLPGSIAAGLLFGAIHATYRVEDPEERDGLVHRHQALGAFLEHWVVTAGMLVLMISGVWLGFLFVPRLAESTEVVGLAMNAHWAGTVMVLFAVSYHVGGLLGGDHREIIPSLSDFRASFRDIGHYLRLSQRPEADKYLPIQKVSYLIWAVLIGVVAGSGLVKAADYPWEIGSGLKASMTLIHDVFALLTILFLGVHIIVVLMPTHLQLLRAQITGWIPTDYVRAHHPRWLPGGTEKRGDGGRRER